ncbi:MAG: hypothetical protein O2800_06520 [Planctomycetota bacterium]|nr:hypothetical protein [Planctomycetota bacterium]
MTRDHHLDGEEELARTVQESAYAYMRSQLEGHIHFDGDRRTIKVAPLPDGRLVAPVMVAMLVAGEVVLELPDDGEDHLQLSVTLTKFLPEGPDGGASDRWQIYHGVPPDVNWAAITIDAGRYSGWFLDGSVLSRANPIAACESAICRTANLEREMLKRVIQKRIGSHPPEALLVGVDPWGFDIRRHCDVVRVAALSGCTIRDEASAFAALQDLAS